MKCESEMEKPEIRHHGGASTLKTNTQESFIWSEYKYSHGKHGPPHKKKFILNLGFSNRAVESFYELS